MSMDTQNSAVPHCERLHQLETRRLCGCCCREARTSILRESTGTARCKPPRMKVMTELFNCYLRRKPVLTLRKGFIAVRCGRPSGRVTRESCDCCWRQAHPPR